MPNEKGLTRGYCARPVPGARKPTSVGPRALRRKITLNIEGAHRWAFAMFKGDYFRLKRPRSGITFLAGRFMRTTTTERNREIFAGFRAGKTVANLPRNTTWLQRPLQPS